VHTTFFIQELKVRPERREDTQGKREQSHHIAQFHTPTFLLAERKLGRSHAVNHLKSAVNCVPHFCIHGSLHRVSNLIIVQQDVTVFSSKSTMRVDGSRPG